MESARASGYVIAPPNTPYRIEADCPIKFANDDIRLDDAIRHITESGKDFRFGNTDLLVQAVMDTPWGSENGD
jgi:hypothetical protein